MSLPIALLLSELRDKQFPYEIPNNYDNGDNLFLSLLNKLDVKPNRNKQTLQSLSEERRNFKPPGALKKHVPKTNNAAEDRTKKNENRPMKYQEAKINSNPNLPPTSNRKLKDRKSLPPSMHKSYVLHSTRNPRSVHPSTHHKKSRYSYVSSNSARNARDNSFHSRTHNQINNQKHLHSPPPKRKQLCHLPPVNNETSRHLLNSKPSLGETNQLSSSTPEYPHSTTIGGNAELMVEGENLPSLSSAFLELVKFPPPTKSSLIGAEQAAPHESISGSFLTPLSGAIIETNNKLNDIIEGCSMDTISPFLFFDSKEFDEEIVIHKALHASRRAFLDTIPENEEFKRAIKGTWTNPDPVWSPQLTSDLLEKASSSKLSVHAAPFTFKPQMFTDEISLAPKMNTAAFLEFLSGIDDETLRSLAPPEDLSSPNYPQPDEERFIKDDEFIQTKKKQDTAPAAVDLKGQELSAEDEKKAKSKSHGPIGVKLKSDGEQKSSAPEIRVMYGGGGILDLGANLLDEWTGYNRWQIGPDPNVQISRPLPHSSNRFLQPRPMFGCSVCVTESTASNSHSTEN